ncbi:hypothetical protein [Thauera sinica]|uniref:Lipoprotein n=1 Tax=Thauera sinica TaxID=2665146 RepID=A0ABW1AKY1_9RHOO|nr:hypothetical protein [Thauera sp. K11]ATE62081.1 hypothetical protein CCZ27_20795 [Thauera sp. K11]
MRIVSFVFALSIGLAAVLLAGCAATATPAPHAQVPFCHKDTHGRSRVCTQNAAPGPERDAEAKQFRASPDALTLYIVRNGRGDWLHAIDVSVDGHPVVETVPGSMVRLRLKPGPHRLAFESGGRTYETTVGGEAGQIVFAGVEGREIAWHDSHAWSGESAERLKARAATARLVADVRYD